MVEEISQQWFQVGDTDIYTTGHYLIRKREVKTIFRSEIFDNGQKISKLKNHEMVTTCLKTERRILFYFFPLKVRNKYLMEGNASGNVVDEIQDILPDKLKEILVEKRRVKYN